MSIQIKFENENDRELVFSMVEVNQFFVDEQNTLWMKVNNSCAIQIAENGKPAADVDDTWDDDYEIRRILPRVKEIKY